MFLINLNFSNNKLDFELRLQIITKIIGVGENPLKSSKIAKAKNKMEELKYDSKIYTDSMSLYEHIIAFKNAEEGYGDDEFVIKINYENSGDLIELVNHLKDYYGDYYGDGWVETVMDSIWSGGWSISEEQQKIFDESYDYWKEMVDKEKSK